MKHPFMRVLASAALFLLFAGSACPVRAASRDVTGEFREEVTELLSGFDDYLAYGCNMHASFEFDNCAKTTMLCMKNVNYLGQTLEQISSYNLRQWKLYFGGRATFEMKKHSGKIKGGSPSQWSNPSNLVQLVDGRARYFGGRWVNAYPRGTVTSILLTDKGDCVATYDFSWYTAGGKKISAMGTYKVTLNGADNRFGFVISNIRRTAAYAWPSMLELCNSVQAMDIFSIGRKAYYGDKVAQQKIKKIIGNIIKKENGPYGLNVSVILAKVIQESGWVSYQSKAAFRLHGANNIIGMNFGNFDEDGTVYAYDELVNAGSRWDSYRSWIPADVTQWNSSGGVYGTHEAMKSYKCIEDCIEDFMAIIVKRHPGLRNNKNIEDYRSFLQSYTPNGDQVEELQNMIDHYDLDAVS